MNVDMLCLDILFSGLCVKVLFVFEVNIILLQTPASALVLPTSFVPFIFTVELFSDIIYPFYLININVITIIITTNGIITHLYDE
jgi:hypothetical protein